jgi:hypothetical protein
MSPGGAGTTHGGGGRQDQQQSQINIKQDKATLQQQVLGNKLSMAPVLNLHSHTQGIRGVSKINHLTTLLLGFHLGG